MKSKTLLAIGLPVLAFAVIGANTASAHGWFGMFGSSATPEEQATRQQEMFTNQAEILGLSVDQVKQAWADGKTMQEIIEENNLSQDDIKTRMEEKQKEQISTHLQALVDQGVITQDQADRRLEVMQNRLENGPGHGGMFHGMGEFRFGHGL